MEHLSIDEEETKEAIPACQLAEDSFGAGILSLIQGFQLLHTPGRRFISAAVLLGFGVVLLAFNAALQLLLLYYIRTFITSASIRSMRSIYSEFHQVTLVNGHFSENSWDTWDPEKRDELCSFPLSQPIFFMVVMLLWVLTMMKEIRSSVQLTNDLFHLPNTQQRGSLLVVRDGEATIMSLTPSLKFTIFVLAIIPKFIVAITLLWVGCRWLTSTLSFGDLILNAVAMEFIVNTDELLYESLMPSLLKHQVACTRIYTKRMCPDATRNEFEGVPLWKYLESLLWVVLSMGFTYVYIFHYQHVLMNYRWDVHARCAVINAV